MLQKILFFFIVLLSFSVSMFGAKKTNISLVKQEDTVFIPEEENRKFQYYFLEALRQKSLGNRDAAADNLFRCYYINSKNAAVLSELANLNISLSRIALAKKYMNAAVRLDPENFWLKQALAQLYIQNREYKFASETYEDILKNNPDKKDYYYVLASLYTQMQQIEKAIDAWNNLEEETGINDRISIEKFKLYLALRKEKKAFSEIDRLIKAFPKETKYKVLKGDLYLAIEESKKAEKNYKAVLDEYPGDPLAKNQLGLFYIQQNKVKEGVTLLISVLQNKEADFDIKKGILSYLSQDSLLSKTVNDSVYLSLITAYPDEEFPYLVYATHLLDQRNTEGFEYISKALDINPKYEDSWNLLINYRSMQNDTIGMLKACREALEHFPDNSEFYYMMGTALRLQKRWDEAVNTWKKAINLLKGKNILLCSVIQGQIGDLYIEKEDKEKAYAAYDTALVYNENNIAVLNNYAYFLTLDGINLAKAERMSGKTIQADPKNPVFLDTYAWVYFKQENYTLALLYIEQAYSNGGNADADVLEHYGDILYKNNDKLKAKEMWKKALSKGKRENNLKLKEKAETGIYVE